MYCEFWLCEWMHALVPIFSWRDGIRTCAATSQFLTFRGRGCNRLEINAEVDDFEKFGLLGDDLSDTEKPKHTYEHRKQSRRPRRRRAFDEDYTEPPVAPSEFLSPQHGSMGRTTPRRPIPIPPRLQKRLVFPAGHPQASMNHDYDTEVVTSDSCAPSPRAAAKRAKEDFNTPLFSSDADFVTAMQIEFNLSRVRCALQECAACPHSCWKR